MFSHCRVVEVLLQYHRSVVESSNECLRPTTRNAKQLRNVQPTRVLWNPAMRNDMWPRLVIK